MVVGFGLHCVDLARTSTRIRGSCCVPSPLGAAEHQDIRWYLEDYLSAPFAVYEQRGRAVQAKLAKWGHALFEAVFGVGKPGRDAYLQSREGDTELVLRSTSPEFLGLPWELIWDPRHPAPLALELRAVDRTLVAAGAAAAVPPGPDLEGADGNRPAGRSAGHRISDDRASSGGPACGGARRGGLGGIAAADLGGVEQAPAVCDGGWAAVPYSHFDGHGNFGSVAATASGDRHQFDGNAAARGYLPV